MADSLAREPPNRRTIAVNGSTLVSIVLVCLVGTAAEGSTSLTVAETPGELRAANGKVAVAFTKEAHRAVITVSAASADGSWLPVCRTLRPDFARTPEANRLFDTSVTPHRYQAGELFTDFEVGFRDDQRVVVTVRGTLDGRIVAEQTLTVDRDSHVLHVDVSASLTEPKLDYVLSSWEFLPTGTPDFVHSPTAKLDDPRSGPAMDQVIGDHAFHAPAIVLQKGGEYACLVPDLAMINACAVLSPDARRTQRIGRNQWSVPILDEHFTMPTALDLNATTGLSPQPIFSYGMMDFVVGHHVRYQRINDASMVRLLAKPDIRYGYDLIVAAGAQPGSGFQAASRHIWKRYGHRQLSEEPHLAMPFAEYVRTIYGVVSRPMPPSVQPPVPGYDDHGVFVDFELDGSPVGGMVSPLVGAGFGDALWNFEFWNNVRDASGMVYWGEKLALPELADRGRRIVSLALAAPHNEAGFFPLVYHVASKQWALSSIGPSPAPSGLFDRSAPVYSVPAMSKTAAHLLEFHERCGPDRRIIDYLRPFADGLEARIDERGIIPSYYTPDMQPIPDLSASAQPAATMWFLAEMARATGSARSLEAAKRIAAYLTREIIPQQRWIDLEPYYSCGRNPLSLTDDAIQGMPIRGNLSTIWAANGFLALYRASANEEYLKTGEKVVDYLAFSQASWDPHFVYTANPFGGCTADNLDTANWLDARQCELVQPFIRYGLELGRQDLVERGVAAARASTVLINHPRHIANGIYPHVNHYGFGLGPENINHEGHNQSAMRTHPSWGECSGIFTGLADAARLTAGGIIDLEHGFAVGTDGISLELQQRGNTTVVTATGRLDRLRQPWGAPYDIDLVIRGRSTSPLLVNGTPASSVERGGVALVPCRVEPDGTVSPVDN